MEWKPVPGYESLYLVSDKGQVLSLRRNKILKPSYSNSGGYPLIIISADGKRIGKYVHHLVLEAFTGPRLEGQEVRHLDGNPRNAILDNLVYGTSSENKYDEVRHGTHPESTKTHCKNGHEFTEENTRIWYYPDGTFRQRVCKQCNAIRYAAWKVRNSVY